jgi:curli biogenesis system outer membrane secretion channel CsgG
MKKNNKKAILFCCLIAVFHAIQAQKVTLENVKEQCNNLPLNKRVRLSVSSFNVATPKASGQFGDELSQMLSNALQNVNCFNVLLSVKDSKQLTDEIAFGQAGNTGTGSAPQTGKMKGPQVIVMGKVTEYAEGRSALQLPGVAVGGNKAHVGFIIQLINAETREIIESKSIEVDGKSNGFQGASLFGLRMVGSIANKAVADACEKGVIQAVEFIASRKDMMPLPEGNSGVYTSKKFDASNCNLLKSSTVPKIMVILPEFHITQRIPDPAGETEIIRRLVEAGFPVVDAAMYASIRGSSKFDEAAKNPTKAISLGKEFGADIVIYGEAFSQRTGVQNNTQVSCRARVEVRAVKTSDATIIVANGLEAGALDNAEFVAAKSALRSAASLISDYLLEQFCSKNISFNQKSSTQNTITLASTEVNVTGADYAKIKPLVDLLTSKGKIIEKSLSNGVGIIKLEHKGSTDSIVETIDAKLGSHFNITSFETGKISLQCK